MAKDISRADLRRIERAQIEFDEQEKIAEAQQKIVGTKQTLENPAIASKVVRESKLPEAEKRKVTKELNNPKAFVNSVQRGSDERKEPSIKDQFIESLTFFMPNIVGLGVGAAIEGTEGAVAGAQQAGRLAGELRKFKLEEEKLKSRSVVKQPKQKIDITPDFVNKATGVPVFTKPDRDWETN